MRPIAFRLVSKTASEAIKFQQRTVAAAATPGSPSTINIPKPGDVLTLHCTEITSGGGLCKLDSTGFVIFVNGALPGEVVTAKIINVNKGRWAKATKLTTITPHDNAVTPLCQHFGTCGGCSLQSLSYEAQLQAKQKRVADVFRRVGAVEDIEERISPILGSENEYGYRNKMEFSFATDSSSSGGNTSKSVSGSRNNRATTNTITNKNNNNNIADDGFILGLHAPGSHNTIVPITRCELQSETANALLTLLKHLCDVHGLGAYNKHSITSTKSKHILQHIVIRQGNTTLDHHSEDHKKESTTDDNTVETYLVNIVTSRDARKELSPLVTDLVASFNNTIASRDDSTDREKRKKTVLASIVNSVSAKGKAIEQRIYSAEYTLWSRHNSNVLTTAICGLDFHVSPNSFFQVNTPQAQRLYQTVITAADLQPGESALDLFCGAGSMTCLLAHYARGSHVVGVDISNSAIDDAKRNAALNNLTAVNNNNDGGDSITSSNNNQRSSVEFLCGDVAELLPTLGTTVPKPDVVVTDPNRAGMDPSIVQFLRKCGARRIVYVSCDVGTCARDVKLLSQPGSGMGEWGYRLVSVQPVDLFPQTFHVENVVVLDRL